MKYRQPVTKENFRTHPIKTGLILGLAIAVALAWVFVVPWGDEKADGAVSHQHQTKTDDRQCLPSDSCSRTQANWQSADHMRDKFNNGSLKNSKGLLLPSMTRHALTKKWNEDHGVVGKGGIWDCGDHWWCGPLDAGTCVISYFVCAGQNLGWQETKVVTLKCGGTAAILGYVAGPAGAGGGGGACLYQTLGNYWGWW